MEIVCSTSKIQYRYSIIDLIIIYTTIYFAKIMHYHDFMRV
jgi:hypothetical protein